MAATSLALTSALFMSGAFAAAIQGEGLERCDFDSESALSPSPAGDVAKRQSNADPDATLESIFGKPPTGSEQQTSSDGLESVSGKPAAGGEQQLSPEYLESIFGKPPAGSQQQQSTDDLESVSGGPAAGDEQQLSPEYLEGIFGKPPPAPEGATANVPESTDQKPATNDDGRVLSVGVYMHIVGKPGSNESAEFFLSVCSTKKRALHQAHLPKHL